MEFELNHKCSLNFYFTFGKITFQKMEEELNLRSIFHDQPFSVPTNNTYCLLLYEKRKKLKLKGAVSQKVAMHQLIAFYKDKTRRYYKVFC